MKDPQFTNKPAKNPIYLPYNTHSTTTNPTSRIHKNQKPIPYQHNHFYLRGIRNPRPNLYYHSKSEDDDDDDDDDDDEAT